MKDNDNSIIVVVFSVLVLVVLPLFLGVLTSNEAIRHRLEVCVSAGYANMIWGPDSKGYCARIEENSLIAEPFYIVEEKVNEFPR